jgi:prephenate dehydrogenase
MDIKTVCVVGLGLIGGSFARAIKENTDCRVLGCDVDRSVLLAAKTAGAIDGILGEDGDLCCCDLTIVALYPAATKKYIENNAPYFKKGAVVCDTCGVKRAVCPDAFALARKHGFHFVGTHPMAGTQFSGFARSRASMFASAPLLLVSDEGEDIPMLGSLHDFFASLGFSGIRFTSPEEHDRMIAYTSQLAHVVSNAYVKSPQARTQKGFSAGSWRDLTRVARLNPDMWADLFIANKDCLVKELDTLIDNLTKYRDEIENGDLDALRNDLAEGSALKIAAEKAEGARK